MKTQDKIALAIYFRDKFAAMPDDAEDPFIHLDYGVPKLFRRAAVNGVTVEPYEPARDYVARDWTPTLLIGYSPYYQLNIWLPEEGSEWAQLRNLVLNWANCDEITEDKKTKKKVWSGDTPMDRWRSLMDYIIRSEEIDG